MNEDGPRDFTSRYLCDLLRKPDHLRDLLSEAVPNLVDGFVFDRMKPAPQEFLVGNSRLRKPDVLVEIPYRIGDAERSALVCVLLEHQSKADWLIPLKTFLYAALYWEWQWRTWETMSAPKEEFALTPILPIVLYTGPRTWGSARSLRDLLGEPTAFHGFAPVWQPLFWELATHSTEELVNGPTAFLQALAIYKAEGAELEVASGLFATICNRLGSLHDSSRIRWEDLLKFVLGWAQNRRPQAERQAWHELAVQLESDEARRREVDQMSITIAESIFLEGEQKGRKEGRKEGRQEGRQEGKQEGKQEGRQEGALEQTKAILLKVTSQRLGQSNPSALETINEISDVQRLDRMTNVMLKVGSWDELLDVK